MFSLFGIGVFPIVPVAFGGELYLWLSLVNVFWPRSLVPVFGFKQGGVAVLCQTKIYRNWVMAKRELANAFALAPQDWEQYMAQLGHKPYRARQVRSWLYEKGQLDPAAMSELPQNLRQNLQQDFRWGGLTLVDRRYSAVDGSEKFLWSLPSPKGQVFVESVLLPKGERQTACLSSQVGCRVGCSFCRTGQMDTVWNLPTWAIVEQYWRMAELSGSKMENIVYMGMGEPFHNYRRVLASAYRFGENPGLGLHPKRITISTVGILPVMERFLQEKQPFGLAVSLNAPDSARRRQIIPVEKHWSMDQLIDFAQRYHAVRNKRLTFEYVLMKGFNDSRTDGELLGTRFARVPAKINLIPYNPTELAYGVPEEESLNTFIQGFLSRGRVAGKYTVITVRRSAGSDIGGACGQLAGNKVD